MMVDPATVLDGWLVMASFVAVEWVMANALEAADVSALPLTVDANVSTLSVPTSLILRSLKVATPDDAVTDVVPDSVPSPVVSDAVTVAVAPPPDVTGFP